jgi:hypothetical protein
VLPQFYQNCFQRQLKKAEYLTRQILVFLLQAHQQVTIKLLATVMLYPIAFESRRRAIQRFLKLRYLNIKKLGFPLIKYILMTQFNKQKELIVAIDRTQWRDLNIFFICLIWQQKALPLYWQILPKKGCSNTREQKKLIIPTFLLKTKYKFALIGDREFGSVKLAKWLGEKNVRFVLQQFPLLGGTINNKISLCNQS